MAQPMQRATQHTTPRITSSASPFIDDKYQVAHYWSKIGVTDTIAYPPQPLGHVDGRTRYRLVSISAPVDGSPVIWVITADVKDGARRVFRFDLSQDKGHDFDGIDPNRPKKHVAHNDCVGTQQLMQGDKPENGVYIMPSAHLNKIARHPVYGVGCRAFLRVLRQQATADNAPLTIAKSRLWHRDFLAWGDPNASAEDDTPIKSSVSALIRTAKQHAAYWKAASNPTFDVTCITVDGQLLRLIHADTRRLDGVDMLWVTFHDAAQRAQLTYKFDPRKDRGKDYTPEGPGNNNNDAYHDDMVGEPIGETLDLFQRGRARGPRKISSRLINDAARHAANARKYVKELAGQSKPAVLIRGDRARGAAAPERDSSSSDDDDGDATEVDAPYEAEEKKPQQQPRSNTRAAAAAAADDDDGDSVQFLRETGAQPAEDNEVEDEYEEEEPDAMDTTRGGRNASPTSSEIMEMLRPGVQSEPTYEDE